jgi:HEAT repeat protein
MAPGVPPDVNVVGTLLHRLMSPHCPVFATATRALGLFLNSHVLPDVEDVILGSGILRSKAFESILDLSSSSNPRIQKSVLSILSTVGFASKSVDDVNACINAGLPQAFRRLLASRNYDVQSSAARAIGEFTTKDGDAQFCNAFLSENLLSALVPLARGRHTQAEWAILEILADAQISSPLEVFSQPDVVEVIIRRLPGRYPTMAENAIRSLLRRYEHVPDALVLSTFIKPIIDLLSSSNDCIQGGAARAIWLIARHDNPYFAKAFLAAGVAQPLATLLSSSNEFVLKTALSAIRTLLNVDGLATNAFRDAGVIEILTPLVLNSVAALAQATISAIDPRHDIGLDDYKLMELSWKLTYPPVRTVLVLTTP